MDKLINNYCSGCGACFNVCPKNAVTMQGDKYGFYKPIVDEEKCVDCGLCEKVCPLNSYKSQNVPEPKVYAFQNKDKETLYKCASGGAFAYIAKTVIGQNGVVYGVIFDENLKVVHSKAETMSELEKMYSSKYVQSDTKDSFRQAKNDLENGKMTLFSGTPCQIAGLKSFLNKEYQNLITADLVCHGVPSPVVFEKYKQEFMQNKKTDEKLLNINFRSKIKGWSPSLITKTTTVCDYHTCASKDIYIRAFLSNLSINLSCLNCKFNTLPRVADISLADFWGVDEYDSALNNNEGLSLIIINNDKGNEIFSKLPKESVLKEIPLEYAIKYNKNICGSSVPNKNRLKFLEELKKGYTLKKCTNKFDKKPFYMVIYGILPKFLKDFIKYKIMKKKK